ncbi:MAG: succinate dehydrogenase iron-sulfur subunit [Thermoproteota archaeon]|nr:succinate dehydrogenase iron-sulfur subunit [Thermoproteota archaeon]
MSERDNIMATDKKLGVKPQNDNFKIKKVTLRVFRTNTAQGKDAHYDSVEVPVQRWTTVLDLLLHAKEYIDSSIGIRYSCRMASCGSCGMKVNGIPRLACYTKISELNRDVVVCEPLPNFPIIRDLVTDFSQFFNHHKSVDPYIQNSNDDKTEENPQSHHQSKEDVDKFLQFSHCIKCGLCYSACPTVATDIKFPGPQALAQIHRYNADSRDHGENRSETVDNRHGIWRCHFAGSCSKVCPKGVDPALGIQLLRSYMLGLSKGQKE